MVHGEAAETRYFDAFPNPQAVFDTNPYGYQLSGLAPAVIYFQLDPATPVGVLGGTGNDAFTVAGPLSATGIKIDGGGGINSLTFNDQTNTADGIYDVTATTVSRKGTALISFASIAHLALYAGTGSNVLYVDSTAAGTTTEAEMSSSVWIFSAAAKSCRSLNVRQADVAASPTRRYVPTSLRS